MSEMQRNGLHVLSSPPPGSFLFTGQRRQKQHRKRWPATCVRCGRSLLSAAVLFLNNEPLSAVTTHLLRTNSFFPPPSNLTSHVSQKPLSPSQHRCSEAVRVITHVKMVPKLLATSIDEYKTAWWKKKKKRGWNFHTRPLMGRCRLQEAIKAACGCCLRWIWSQIFGRFPPGRSFLEYPAYLQGSSEDGEGRRVSQTLFFVKVVFFSSSAFLCTFTVR